MTQEIGNSMAILRIELRQESRVGRERRIQFLRPGSPGFLGQILAKLPNNSVPLSYRNSPDGLRVSQVLRLDMADQSSPSGLAWVTQS